MPAKRHAAWAAALGLPLVVAFSALSGRGQDPVGEDPVLTTLDRRTRVFLAGLAVSNELAIESSFDELLTDSPLRDQAEQIVIQTQELEPKYGAFREVHLVSAKRVGDDLVLLKYLHELERYPVVWYFTWYRSYKKGDRPAFDQNWTVTGVRFDTRLELLAL